MFPFPILVIAQFVQYLYNIPTLAKPLETVQFWQIWFMKNIYNVMNFFILLLLCFIFFRIDFT